MSPLAALLLIGFLFVIALCLTVWAAMSLAAAPRRHAEREREAYVPLSRPEAPVWRAERGTARAERGTAASRTVAPAPVAGGTVPAYGRTTVTARVKGTAASPQPATPERRGSNDDVRGAKAKVTQRPNLDDAFERFLENERDR